MKLLCGERGLIPMRAAIAIMIFTACLFSYMLRVNMSINIIAMVEPTQQKDQNGTNTGANVPECAAGNFDYHPANSSQHAAAAIDYGTRYNWDSNVQGLILGAYFWGYTITCIPGGYLAERFGPTKIVGLTSLMSAALTILTPLCASWHHIAVLVCRFMLGFLGGVIYPALHCLVSRWAPPEEKGKFTGALLGGAFGTVITWPLLGAISESMTWPWAFYLPGVATLIWCVVWFLVVADTPDEHKNISEEEKIYIAKAIGDTVNNKVKRIPPYVSIFTSIPFLALMVLHFGNLWGLYLLMTAGPKFMSEVLGFNLSHSGGLAAIPYLARMLSGFAFGSVGDILRRKKILSVTWIRKIFVTFSHVIPGLLLFALLLVGCNAPVSVALITLSMGFNGASTITNLQNSQDLAPNFAGTLYGIINCIGGTTGFITPQLTGAITSEHSGLKEWHLIFAIGASVYVGCGIIYFIFGTGLEQPWNREESQSDKNLPPPTGRIQSTLTDSGIVNEAFEEVNITDDGTTTINNKLNNTKF